jgi:molybdopterin converting factor subunit 1
MRVTIKLFARLRDIVGVAELVREVDAPATIDRVWAGLTREFPALNAYSASVSAARNAEYVPRSAEVGEGDEVAFLPPVSGGMEDGGSLWCSRIRENRLYARQADGD